MFACAPPSFRSCWLPRKNKQTNKQRKTLNNQTQKTQNTTSWPLGYQHFIGLFERKEKKRDALYQLLNHSPLVNVLGAEDFRVFSFPTPFRCQQLTEVSLFTAFKGLIFQVQFLRAQWLKQMEKLYCELVKYTHGSSRNTESLMNTLVWHCSRFAYTSCLLRSISTARFQSTVTKPCIFKFVSFYKTDKLLGTLSVEFCSDPRTVVYLELKPVPVFLLQQNLLHHLLPFTINL